MDYERITKSSTRLEFGGEIFENRLIHNSYPVFRL